VFLTNRHAGTLNWTEDSVSAMGHRDGRVVKDEPVANRRDADTELALLPPIT